MKEEAKIEEMISKLSKELCKKLDKAIKDKFFIEAESNFDTSSMELTSTRTDRQAFTIRQSEFVQAFCRGYMDAISVAADLLKS